MSDSPTQTTPAGLDAIIAHEELRARLGDRSFILIDVLPAESYAAGHIPGAVSLPFADLHERASAVLPDKSREIVAYCAAFT